MIRPETWHDTKLSKVSAEAHMLAAALLNITDSHGYFLANPDWVRKTLFPFRKLEQTIRALLDELGQAGYCEFCWDGARLIGRIPKHAKFRNLTSDHNESELCSAWHGTGFKSVWWTRGIRMEDPPVEPEPEVPIIEQPPKIPRAFKQVQARADQPLQFVLPAGALNLHEEVKRINTDRASPAHRMKPAPKKPEPKPSMSQEEKQKALEAIIGESVSAQEVIDTWNVIAKANGWLQTRGMSGVRNTLNVRLRNREWKAALPEVWERLRELEAEPFMRGENDRKWIANIDWFLRLGTFEKVLTGFYGRSLRGAATGTSSGWEGACEEA